MAGHTKYMGSKGNVIPNPTQTEFHNHSKEETTMTTTNNAAVNTAETVDLVTAAQEPSDIKVDAKTVETAPAAVQAVEENEGRLKAIKGGKGPGSRFAWEGVIAAGAVATIGSVAGMVTHNRMAKRFDPENGRQYSAIEMAGVATVTGLVASGLMAAVQQIDVINETDEYRLIATAAIANGTAVTSVFLRDKALDMFSSREVSLADYVTEEDTITE